jgi:hypothetical protein
MTLAGVEYLVIGFPGTRFSGEIVAALAGQKATILGS